MSGTLPGAATTQAMSWIARVLKPARPTADRIDQWRGQRNWAMTVVTATVSLIASSCSEPTAVVGKVVGPQGQPLAGFDVGLVEYEEARDTGSGDLDWQRSGMRLSTRTGANGRFVLPVRQAGRYGIVALNEATQPPTAYELEIPPPRHPLFIDVDLHAPEIDIGLVRAKERLSMARRYEAVCEALIDTLMGVTPGPVPSVPLDYDLVVLSKLVFWGYDADVERELLERGRPRSPALVCVTQGSYEAGAYVESASPWSPPRPPRMRARAVVWRTFVWQRGELSTELFTAYPPAETTSVTEQGVRQGQLREIITQLRNGLDLTR